MSTSAYAGWLRSPPGPWREVCRAATWDQCWARLLWVPADGARAERIVLPAGVKPGRTRAKEHRSGKADEG